MQLLRPDTSIDFVGQSKLFSRISIGLVLACLALMFLRTINWGIDFAGGTVLQLGIPEAAGAIDEGRLRSHLVALGFPDAVVVRFGAAEERVFLVNLAISE